MWRGSFFTGISTTLLPQRDSIPWSTVRQQQSAAHKSTCSGTACRRQMGYPRRVFINGLVHSLNSSKLSTEKRSCNYLLVRHYKRTEEWSAQQPDRRHCVGWRTQQLQNKYEGNYKHSTEQNLHSPLPVNTDLYSSTDLLLLVSYFVLSNAHILTFYSTLNAPHITKKFPTLTTFVTVKLRIVHSGRLDMITVYLHTKLQMCRAND